MDFGIKENRLIFDPIKKTQIEISSLGWNVIDTPYFQRLSNTCCTGASSYVFASANHNYFNKTLGLIFNSNQFAQNLKLDKYENECLFLASLGYYLGATPYQRAFTSFMVEDKGVVDYNFEDTSCLIMDAISDYLLKNKGIKIFTDDSRELIFDIIKGNPRLEEKNYLYHILNNKTYRLDILKMNNIERDCYFYGVEEGYDYDIPMSTVKVINNKLAYNEKATSQIYELFKCYYKLERHIYNHRVIIGIDLMLQDIFKLTDKKIDYMNLIQNPDEFVTFNDSFFSMIIDPCLKKSKYFSTEAKALVDKINKRDFYKFVGEIVINKNMIHPEKITKYNIVSASLNNNLKEEDLIIKKINLSYGNKDKDPLEKASFYSNKSNSLVEFNSDNYLLDRPYKFEEEIVRVYVKDKSKFLDAVSAFRCFSKNDYMGLNHDYDKYFSAKKNVTDFTFSKSESQGIPADFSEFLKLKEKQNN